MKQIIMKPGLGYMDTIVSKIILKTLPFWKKINFNPNLLTTLGLISSVLSLYYLSYHYLITDWFISSSWLIQKYTNFINIVFIAT